VPVVLDESSLDRFVPEYDTGGARFCVTGWCSGQIRRNLR
jgi:hypothetical protein